MNKKQNLLPGVGESSGNEAFLIMSRGREGEVCGCKFSFPERCWAWQPRDCSPVSAEDRWGHGWLRCTCPLPHHLSHHLDRMVLSIGPAPSMLILETASMACSVDAHPQADGLRQLLCHLWMLLSPSDVWVSVKDGLREIRRGSVQGNECILQARKLLVGEVTVREAV